jgi:membrane-associated phospholipid phosphatase
MSTRTSVEHRSGRVSGRVLAAVAMAAKLIIICAFFVLCSLLYTQINEWAFHSPRTRYFRSPREAFPGVIQPWTAVVYVFGGYLAPLLPFLYNWSWSRLRLVLRAYALTSLMMFAVFLIFPVGMHRPSYSGADLGERLMLAVFAVDRETNCFPSGHAAFAVLSAILVSHGGAARWIRVGVWGLAAAICATTVTTGQHYYLDAVAGALTAVAGFYASLALGRMIGFVGQADDPIEPSRPTCYNRAIGGNRGPAAKSDGRSPHSAAAEGGPFHAEPAG